MNKVQVIKGSSSTSVKDSFEIMAAKFVSYFEGGKIRKIKIYKEKFSSKLKQGWSIEVNMTEKGVQRS